MNFLNPFKGRTTESSENLESLYRFDPSCFKTALHTIPSAHDYDIYYGAVVGRNCAGDLIAVSLFLAIRKCRPWKSTLRSFFPPLTISGLIRFELCDVLFVGVELWRCTRASIRSSSRALGGKILQFKFRAYDVECKHGFFVVLNYFFNCLCHAVRMLCNFSVSRNLLT